jgi:hypothetical protein
MVLILFYNEGFLSAEECTKSDLPTLTIKRLWNVQCDPLELVLPTKHLHLRRYHKDFLKGTIAQYECDAGYGFENETLVGANIVTSLK